MFTLIKREIEDHIAYFIGAAILSVILIILSILAVFAHDDPGNPPVLVLLSIPGTIVLIICLAGMGVSQMYTDRNRRISAFLCALPVTRGQILTARIITGILAILTLLVPVTITALALLRLFAPPVPIYSGYSGFIFDIFIVTFLMSFSCYCLGLQTGWTSSRITPTLGGVALSFVLVPLILVKGFGSHIVVILVLFITASLVRTWHRFTSTSL
jgi:ABC-type transport system involved in multi-copper enzyme maturation permease subunit